MQERVRWEISVSIFKNRVLLKQLGLAIGIPFSLVALILVIISEKNKDTLYALGFIAILLIFTCLLIMVVYGGKYEVEFMLDNRGVLCQTQVKQRKRNQVINTLVVIFGLLASKPTVFGSGLLAQSRQEVFIGWNCVTKVKYKPQSHTILLWGGLMKHIALFCTHDNYGRVENFILQRTGQA